MLDPIITQWSMSNEQVRTCSWHFRSSYV